MEGQGALLLQSPGVCGELLREHRQQLPRSHEPCRVTVMHAMVSSVGACQHMLGR